MNIEILIELEEDSLSSLTEGARNKLSEQTKSFAKELLHEAIRIEEGEREEGANCEITSSIVMQAGIVKKYRNYSEKNTPMWLKIVKILSPISFSITGFLFDLNGFENNMLKLIGFIIAFAIACVSTAVVYMKEK